MINQPDNLTPSKASKELYGASNNSIKLIGHSGNSVYSFIKNKQKYILRLTDPSFRSFEENEGELEYINHLTKCNLPVAASIPDVDGDHLKLFNGFICSAFSYAPGELVTNTSKYWSKKFFNDWGSSLAGIHMSSISFKSNTNKRWTWHNEILFKNAKELIPSNNLKCIEELSEVIGFLNNQAITSKNFGLTHADFAPQNFNYDEEKGITVFDFGNCCYHWYISDLAISLSTLRAKDNREQIRDWILEGYNSVRSLSQADLELIDWFIRLRVLYYYLSRLYKFTPSPTAEESKTLKMIKAKVEEKRGWN